MESFPDGMSAAYLVVDADSGTILRSRDEHRAYRSASLVKLLIAWDHLSRLGGRITEADRGLLEPMLRASHDDAATELWDRGGRGDIIDRVVTEIGLTGTTPPRDPDMWGYTPLTASDVVRIYRYLRGEGRIGEYVLDNLREFTEHGADGFDQTFGVPSGTAQPDAVKQGWSGFGPGPAEPPAINGKSQRRIRDDRIDLDRPAMHTTGLVRHGDQERIMVVLTLQPTGTGWETSAARITELTRVLDAG